MKRLLIVLILLYKMDLYANSEENAKQKLFEATYYYYGIDKNIQYLTDKLAHQIPKNYLPYLTPLQQIVKMSIVHRLEFRYDF